MPSNLQELIAPLSESEFSGLLRTRSLTFRRGLDEKRFEGLFDWNTFRGVIESGAFPADKLHITRDGRKAPSRVYAETGKLNAANVAKLIDLGASLIALPLDPYVPVLGALCAEIEKHIAEKIYAGAIMTTGNGGALELHYDPEDLIVLQLEGSKRWKIYGTPVAVPVGGMPKQIPPQGEPAFDEILRPGDFLFLPAGYWHHCENGPGRSLHVGIFIEPPTGYHAIKALVPQLVAEEIFRLPLTRFASAAESAAHEAVLKARLIAKIETMSLPEMIAEGERIKVLAAPDAS